MFTFAQGIFGAGGQRTEQPAQRTELHLHRSAFDVKEYCIHHDLVFAVTCVR